MKKIFLAIVFLIFGTNGGFATNYVISGAGTAAVNGTYVPTAYTSYSVTVYSMGSKYLFYTFGGGSGQWQIGTDYTNSNVTALYYWGYADFMDEANPAVASYGNLGSLGSGAKPTCVAAPLPVQLTTLTAAATSGSSVTLKWTTASEVNNFGFYVQRKRQSDNDFSDIAGAFVAGHRTTTAAQSYEYTLSGAVDSKTSFRLKQVDLDGTPNFSEPVTLSTTGIAETAPVVFALNQNYPNPFNPTTTISYDIASTRQVTLTIFDMLGREVATLVDGVKVAGRYQATFDAARLASGVYVYCLKAGDFTDVKKLALVK